MSGSFSFDLSRFATSESVKGFYEFPNASNDSQFKLARQPVGSPNDRDCTLGGMANEASARRPRKPPRASNQPRDFGSASGLQNNGFPEDAELPADLVSLLRWRSGETKNNDAACFFGRRDLMPPD